MDKVILEKLKKYASNNPKKMFALRDWININMKSFSLTDAMLCIFEEAKGDWNEITNIIEHLTAKKKVYGRTQVYNTMDGPRMDITRDENGNLRITGYNPTAPLPLKGQKVDRNPKIFRKADDQVNKRYEKEEEKFLDVGQRLRKLFPNASNEELTHYIFHVREYAVQHKVHTDKVMDALESGRYVFDPATYKVRRKHIGEGRVIVISESMMQELKDELEMTEYKFKSNIKQFLSDLLSDPVNAEVPYIFKSKGFNRSRLLGNLLRDGIIIKQQRISDKDENGEPKTATMMVKYLVPKKNFDRKLNRLYIKLFERNVPEKRINEDGEGGCVAMGATSCDSSSGQFSQPLFGVRRREIYGGVTETTATSNVGDYQYDVPFAGDDETLDRNNGVGGSNSINIVDEGRKKVRKNDKGEVVPEICPKCGSKVGLFIKGEPVFLCTNKECNEFFGTMPFKS